VDRLTLRSLTILTAIVSVWLLTVATVQAEALMNAVSFRPVPTGATIFVRAMDNSDSNMALLKDFEKSLKRKGYKISPDANLIMTFETREAAGSWVGGGPNRIVELSNNHDQSGTDAPRVHLNLFNSSRGGLLNSNRKEATRTVTPSSFRIDVTVDNKTDGKRHWQGWSSADTGYASDRKMTRAMIPAIVEGIGQTISQKPIAELQ
jgi:hypothetical protein